MVLHCVAPGPGQGRNQLHLMTSSGDGPRELPGLVRLPLRAGGDVSLGGVSDSKSMISGSSSGSDCWLLAGVEGSALEAEADLVLLEAELDLELLGGAGGVVLRVRADLAPSERLDGTRLWKAAGPEVPDPAEELVPLERVPEGLGLPEGLVVGSDANLTLFRGRGERVIGPAGLGVGLGAALR